MQINIGSLFLNRATLTPDLEAFVANDERLSFKAANIKSNQFASYLIKHGIYPGDRVAVLCKNYPHVLTAMIGTLKAGAIFVPLNYRLKGPELIYILNNCGASFLVFDQEFKPLIEEIRESVEARYFMEALSDDAEIGLEAKLALMHEDEPAVGVSGDDAAVILYTSGTTGNPKGAVLSHNNLFWAAVGLVHSINWFARYRFLSVAPLFHSGGLAPMIGNILAGVTTVFMPNFDPAAVWQVIQKEKINFMMSVPAMLKFMLLVPGIDKMDLSSLDHIVCGGSPVPEELILTYKKMGIKIENVFGITEHTGAVSFWTHDQDPAKSNSAGLPVFNAKIKICSPDSDKTLAPGEIGEICCSGPQVFCGYWGNPDATQKATQNGFYRSGDLGMVDAAGYLYVVDRLKDMVVSGGENIYPAEIEQVILSMDGIADVAVVGRSDAKWGEVPVALVVTAEGADIQAADIIHTCKKNLASYKCVKEIIFTSAIPRNALGKILKKDIRESLSQ